MIKTIAQLIRLKQWIKNLFVLFPIFFSKQLFNTQAWIVCIIATFCFCLVASAVYCINDIVDRKKDQLHPKKKFRPLASGRVNLKTAIVYAIMLLFCGLSINLFMVGVTTTYILSSYFLLNIAYSFWLKNIAIIDAFIIAIGFVLRIYIGCIAISVWISPWMVCMTFLLTLFLAFSKRRNDFIIEIESGIKIRESVSEYSLLFLNILIGMLSGVTLVCYIMFTLSDVIMERVGSQYLYFTSIFVFAGMIRYLLLVFNNQEREGPTEILWHDKFLISCIVLWILSYGFLMYL